MKWAKIMTLIETIFYIDKKRIEWVDIAKGIAIILVIIGHTVPVHSIPFYVIFSFHMPLFFLLAGYVFKTAETKQDLYKHLIKNLKHLIIPSLVFTIITSIIYHHIMYNNTSNNTSLLNEAAFHSERFLWGSGISVNGHPPLGMIWFLISLFWARAIIDILHLVFSHRQAGYLCLSLGILGIALGLNGIWLPQNMDVTFVAVLFIYLGMLWKRNTELLEKKKFSILIISIIVWITCIHFHFYSNMAWRHYPTTWLMITESVCGSYVFCYICKLIESICFIRIPMQMLGIHSLCIFFFHSGDSYFVPIWTSTNIEQAIFNRIIYALTLSILFLIVRSLIKMVNSRKNPAVLSQENQS